MSRVKDKIQGGGVETIIHRCHCGEDSFFTITFNDKWEEYFLGITVHPTRIKSRLSEAWKALRGREFSVSNELILSHDQLKDLYKDLTNELGEAYTQPKPTKKGKLKL